MAMLDLRTLCTALGFTAVVVQGGSHKRNGAVRARKIADLIEEFCTTGPGVAPARDTDAVDAVIEKFKATLRDEGSALLPQDRESLLAIYDRLQQRRARRAQKHFYEMAHDGMIANAILKMIDEEIEHDEDGT